MNKKRLLVVAGAVFSVVLLVAVFYRLDWPVFVAALRDVRPGGVLLAAAAIFVAILVRAWRWRIIYGDHGRVYAHFQATCIGYLGNTIYPAKAGEVLRVFALARAESAPVARSMVTALADRLNDVLILALMMMVVLAIHGEAVVGPASRVVSGIVIAGTGAVVAILVVRGKLIRSLLVWLVERVPTRTRGWLSQARIESADLVSRLRQPRVVAGLITANLAAAGADYSAIWLVLSACGHELPFAAALTVGVFLAAGQSLPSSPGYVGIYQVAVIFALRLFGIPQEPALAASFVLQLMTIVVIVILGAWATSSLGSEMLRRRESGA